MTLDSIIERLEKAEGGDRELDCYLWVVGKGGDARMHYISDNNEFVWERGVDGMWIRSVERLKTVPRYTSSVDAAIALAEKVSPGWRYAVERRVGGTCLAWVSEEDNTPCFPSTAPHCSIALCLAILKAKQMGVGE